jgi:hypothetical protein
MPQTISSEAQVRRGLIVVVVLVFIVPIIIYIAPMLLLAYAVSGADPYPAFMADYQAMRSGSYDVAERAFPDFIARKFPIGSDRSDAIAQITKGGFAVTKSTPEMVELRWNRHAGPCSEQFSIVINGGADGMIAGTGGRLQPICL